jgi:hypothetical protein
VLIAVFQPGAGEANMTEALAVYGTPLPHCGMCGRRRCSAAVPRMKPPIDLLATKNTGSTEQSFI